MVGIRVNANMVIRAILMFKVDAKVLYLVTSESIFFNYIT
jgi:hypothetical protein